MIANMVAWVLSNTPPPQSSYPKVSDGTLVPLRRYAFPSIPGVSKPHEANEGTRLYFGPKWRDGILSIQPPRVGSSFPAFVPQVDADGNERDGVRLPEITVPLATFTGWNLRDASIGAPDQRVAFEASFLPFPKTAADRQKTGDPRKSIAERYSSRDDYMTRFTNALNALVEQGWVLPEDRPALLHLGEQEWTESTK